MGAFPKGSDGKMIFSDVDYIETYKVNCLKLNNNKSII